MLARLEATTFPLDPGQPDAYSDAAVELAFADPAERAALQAGILAVVRRQHESGKLEEATRLLKLVSKPSTEPELEQLHGLVPFVGKRLDHDKALLKLLPDGDPELARVVEAITANPDAGEAVVAEAKKRMPAKPAVHAAAGSTQPPPGWPAQRPAPRAAPADAPKARPDTGCGCDASAAPTLVAALALLAAAVVRRRAGDVAR